MKIFKRTIAVLLTLMVYIVCFYNSFDHHCKQSLPYSCAPASCVEALSYIHIAVTEQEMIELCKTTTQNRGTTLPNLKNALDLKLKDTNYKLFVAPYDDEEYIFKDGSISLVVISVGFLTCHCICIYGEGDGCAILQDPLENKAIDITTADLSDIYVLYVYEIVPKSP